MIPFGEKGLQNCQINLWSDVWCRFVIMEVQLIIRHKKGEKVCFDSVKNEIAGRKFKIPLPIGAIAAGQVLVIENRVFLRTRYCVVTHSFVATEER